MGVIDNRLIKTHILTSFFQLFCINVSLSIWRRVLRHGVRTTLSHFEIFSYGLQLLQFIYSGSFGRAQGSECSNGVKFEKQTR